MSIPSKEQLKARSKHLAKILQEKYNLKISHGHCLDVVAQLFGHKDWNTASALSPDEDSPKSESGSNYTPWLEALTKGYPLSIEQPYQKEIFHVGRATAQRSSEQGIRSWEFTPRIDEKHYRVILTLPTEARISTSDAVIGMHKQLYHQREKNFSEKTGGKAENICKA